LVQGVYQVASGNLRACEETYATRAGGFGTKKKKKGGLIDISPYI